MRHSAPARKGGLDFTDAADQDGGELDLVRARPSRSGPAPCWCRAARRSSHRPTRPWRSRPDAVLTIRLVPSQKFHRGEQQAEARFTRQRPAGVADQHIDLARLQGSEAVLRRQRHETDLRRVPQAPPPRWPGSYRRPARASRPGCPPSRSPRSHPRCRTITARAPGRHPASPTRFGPARRLPPALPPRSNQKSGSCPMLPLSDRP